MNSRLRAAGLRQSKTDTIEDPSFANARAGAAS